MNANVSDKGQAPDMPQRNEAGQPTSQKTKAPTKARSAKWLVAALLVLSAIPITAGAFRLTQLAGGAVITPANARFFASPLPVVLHIFSVSVYAILGAFQFVPRLRRRRHSWHRVAGRLVVGEIDQLVLTESWMQRNIHQTGQALSAHRRHSFDRFWIEQPVAHNTQASGALGNQDAAVRQQHGAAPSERRPGRVLVAVDPQEAQHPEVRRGLDGNEVRRSTPGERSLPVEG